MSGHDGGLSDLIAEQSRLIEAGDWSRLSEVQAQLDLMLHKAIESANDRGGAWAQADLQGMQAQLETDIARLRAQISLHLQRMKLPPPANSGSLVDWTVE